MSTPPAGQVTVDFRDRHAITPERDRPVPGRRMLDALETKGVELGLRSRASIRWGGLGVWISCGCCP
jgi:hypothetical protein